MDKDIAHTFIDFDSIKLDSVLYIKLLYSDENGNQQEIKTNIASDSNSFLFLRYDDTEKFNIACPQQVNIKIITLETLYQAEVTLSEVLYHYTWTSFSIRKPQKIERIQEREYYRVKTTNKMASVYFAKPVGIAELNSTIFDLSIKSIKIYNLQDKKGNPVCDMDFKNIRGMKIKIRIESLIDLTLPVVFLQHRIQDDLDTYIFQFSPIRSREEMLLSKFLTEVQRIQLRKNNDN